MQSIELLTEQNDIMYNDIRSYLVVFVVFVSLLLVGSVSTISQTRRPSKAKPKTQKTIKSTSLVPTPTPTPTRGAGDPTKPGTKPGPITPTFAAEPTASYAVPYYERCPKQPTDGTKVYCVGIGGGSDIATPEEVEKIHNTISRIFFGRRFVMVKLKGETLYNQEDDAKLLKCDYFIQTQYSSPFEKGDGARFLEFLTAITDSNLPGNTNKIINRDDPKLSEKLDGFGGSINNIFRTINPFSKKPKFELNLRVFRTGELPNPVFSIAKSMKVGKNDQKAEVLNAIYRLLRDSTEMLQTGVMDPTKLSGPVTETDKDKKDKKDKN